jgi:hypothetical protein
MPVSHVNSYRDAYLLDVDTTKAVDPWCRFTRSARCDTADSIRQLD